MAVRISRRKSIFGLALIVLTLVFNSPVLATAPIRENTENHDGSVTHIDQQFVSPFLTLQVEADVITPQEGMDLAIYVSDYPIADDNAWKAFFFGDEDIIVKNELDNFENYADILVYYPELEHFYSFGEMTTRYVAYDARMVIQYRNVGETRQWSLASEGENASGITTTPQMAQSFAQQWVNEFTQITGWGDFVFEACYTMPAQNTQYDETQEMTGYYIVEFRHMLGDLFIASDMYYPSDMGTSIFGSDIMQIYIDGQGIFKVDAYYRTYQQTATQTLEIPLEQALLILKENMDYLPFYSTNNVFKITQIDLCYRLVQTRPLYDKDVNAYLEARPAWRFATGTVRPADQQNQYVMFIDAITGQVLP